MELETHNAAGSPARAVGRVRLVEQACPAPLHGAHEQAALGREPAGFAVDRSAQLRLRQEPRRFDGAGNQAEPDVILLGGDIVDDNNPLENARSFFEALVGAKIPAYYVSGNHDRRRPDFESVLEMIRGYGVNVLEGKSVVVDLPGGGKINLCGLREYATAEACASSLEESFSDLSQETYNLLLAHRPDYIDLYRKYPFDLVLSDHAHGGQVRIPFLINGLYAPNQGWFPKYAGGRYDVEGTQLIVSRGLSYFPLLPRVFNPPEVVVIDVEGCA